MTKIPELHSLITSAKPVMNVRLKKFLLSAIALTSKVLAKAALQTLQNAQYTEVLKRTFSELQPTMVLDVGGNQGQYHAYIRNQIGFRGIVCTFEPNPVMVAKMSKKSERFSNWHIFPIALGDEESQLDFNITESGYLSSFLKPDSSLVNLSGNKVSKVQKVPVRRLDQVVADLVKEGDVSRIFLKWTLKATI